MSGDTRMITARKNLFDLNYSIQYFSLILHRNVSRLAAIENNFVTQPSQRLSVYYLAPKSLEHFSVEPFGFSIEHTMVRKNIFASEIAYYLTAHSYSNQRINDIGEINQTL